MSAARTLAHYTMLAEEAKAEAGGTEEAAIDALDDQLYAEHDALVAALGITFRRIADRLTVLETTRDSNRDHGQEAVRLAVKRNRLLADFVDENGNVLPLFNLKP
jgi:hypothetical protein